MLPMAARDGVASTAEGAALSQGVAVMLSARPWIAQISALAALANTMFPLSK